MSGADLDQAILALEDGDAEQTRHILRLAGVDVDAIKRLPRRPEIQLPRDTGTIEVLTGSFRRTGPGPAAVLLILYLTHECNQTWESTYRFGPIQMSLRAAHRAWRATTAAPARGDAAVVAALAAAALLDQEIAVESALTTISLNRVTTASAAAVRSATRLARLAARARAAAPVLADLLAERAASALACYRALCDAAGTADRFLVGDGTINPRSTGTAGKPENLDEHLDDTRRSEVRAHRMSLRELTARESDPWLTLDLAKITYLYPFGIRTPEHQGVVQAVRDHGFEWKFAGAQAVDVRNWLGLDDMWEGTDLRRRRFEGAVLELPQVTIDVGGRRVASLQTELRFSQLGNHSLRFVGTVEDAGPQEVYAALFRAAPQHGRGRVRCGSDGPVFDRLSDLAAEIVNTLPQYLHDASVSMGRGTYHVILSVLEASIGAGPNAARSSRGVVTDARELSAAVGGQILLHPVTNSVGSVVEWCRYQPDPEAVISGVGRKEDMVVRTCNTTLLAMPASPRFVLEMYESVAEFVASLDGMYAAWHDELTHYYSTVLEVLSNRPSDIDFEAYGTRLQDFVADARAVLALISSPQLVSSPVDAEIVNRFLATSGFDAVRADFNAKVDDVLNDRFARIAAAARIREERAREVQQHRINTLLAVIAAVGVSGMFQLLQAGFDWQWSGAVILFSLVLVIAALVGLAALRWFRPGRR
jgi:hypothetical protein